MIQTLSIISIIVISIGFVAIILFLYPKLFLKFSYSKSISEGIKSSDNTYYVSEDKYSQVIEKYELVKNFKDHKKYAVITLKDNINVASFGIYSFNIEGRAFDYMKASFSDISNQVIIEVKKNTFGLYVFPISFNNTENEYDESGVRLFRSNIVKYSIFSAITSVIYSVIFSLILSFIVSNNPFYIFANIGNIGIYILMIILLLVLVGAGSYFTVFFTNRSFIDEVGSE